MTLLVCIDRLVAFCSSSIRTTHTPTLGGKTGGLERREIGSNKRKAGETEQAIVTSKNWEKLV